MQIEDQYETKMSQEYQKQIFNNTLEIQDDSQLKSLKFMENFHIQELKLSFCGNIIPKLNSKTIKQLDIICCKVLNVEQLDLVNLEVLQLFEDEKHVSTQLTQITQLLQSIVEKYSNLKELCLEGFKGIKISPLSQKIELTKVGLIDCNLKNIDALKSLINLKELLLVYNKEIDITPLQFLNQLTSINLAGCALQNVKALKSLVNLKQLFLQGNSLIDITSLQYLKALSILDLRECKLQSIDTLKPLLNLEELNISANQIVYSQPLGALKKLIQLKCEDNKIIDFQIIEKLPNFKYFKQLISGDQQLPTKLDIVQANILRNINAPITHLRTIYQMTKMFKTRISVQKYKAEEYLQQSCQNQINFTTQIASLFQKLNATGDQ
ncbi:leucine-rich_repeat domain-containing protein [Hexamita inflata]|uniref:Leucine-rich repeat domain-containing protein n=1 Tax=Hexamita inflata TaxID=28002 RepID=A0AA86NG84_9EUKA|nr:leucine-rich repeat domain-containing protein [Hexamita inflata]